MGQIYTIQFNAVAVTAQQDFFELVAPSTGIVMIHEIGLSNVSDFGDAQEEGLAILLKSGQGTTGSGGGTVTPVKRSQMSAAASGTYKSNNTTKASAGTPVTHYAWNWNERIPFLQVFTPETRPVISPSRRATLELATTPADSVTISGYMVIEEIG